jgi:hypothetical protein
MGNVPLVTVEDRGKFWRENVHVGFNNGNLGQALEHGLSEIQSSNSQGARSLFPGYKDMGPVQDGHYPG